MSRTISWIFVLLVVAAFLGAPAAYGQVAMNCTASVPVQASIRAEGLTELVGDIIITCTGGTPVASGPYPTITLNIYMSALVTSRVLVSATPTGHVERDIPWPFDHPAPTVGQAHDFQAALHGQNMVLAAAPVSGNPAVHTVVIATPLEPE